MNQPLLPHIAALLDPDFQPTALFNCHYAEAVKQSGEAAPRFLVLFFNRAIHMIPLTTMAYDVGENRMEPVKTEPTVLPNGRTVFPARPTCAG